MFRRSMRVMLFLGAVLLTSELRRQEEELDRATGGLANVGDELEESQGQVEEAKLHQKDLGRRARELEAALEAQKDASARSRARLEDRVQVAYRGGDLGGLLLLLEGLFGAGDAQGSTSTTLQATRLRTESSRSIQDYKDTRQHLRSTLRQLEQSKAEHEQFGAESEVLVEELKGRESKLRASVEGLGLKRDLMEKRLAELEAQGEAGLLRRPLETGAEAELPKRPPTTANEEVGSLRRPSATDRRDDDGTRGWGGAQDLDKGKTRSREEDRAPDRDENTTRSLEESKTVSHADGRDGRHNRNDGRDRQEHEDRKQATEREIEIAREDIVTRPVEPVPYEEYVRLYKESAERYGFAGDWYVLAAVGKIESNHGENMGPSGAGAMGPMQFLPATWSSYGVDGDGDGEANIVDPEDAIPAAAAYLKAGGAPEDWYAALFTYNRAGWYVEEVLAIAESYRRIHGDDIVGPYLKPALAPAVEASPRSEPAPRPDEVSDGGEDIRQELPSKEVTPRPDDVLRPDDVPDGGETSGESRPSEEVTPPLEKKTQPADDGLDMEEETAPEPEDPAAGDDATIEQYQYEAPHRTP